MAVFRESSRIFTHKNVLKTISEMLLNVVGCLPIDVLVVAVTLVHELAVFPPTSRKVARI